jgi:hypothetical protein
MTHVMCGFKTAVHFQVRSEAFLAMLRCAFHSRSFGLWILCRPSISRLQTKILVQLRDVLKTHTSVLAGPSGAGKSSIINFLRQESFDAAQSARLARFQEAMTEELGWYMSESDADLDSDDSQHGASKDGATTESRGSCVPSDAELQHSRSAKKTDKEGGKDAPHLSMRGRRAERSEQQKWKKKTGDIYGAQVCLGVFGIRNRPP